MAGMIIPRETTKELGPAPGGQYTTIVTPEAIAGAEVRNWERLGKAAEEITKSVIHFKNVQDLDEVNRAETKIKEVLMRRKLSANEKKGNHTAGLLGIEERFFDTWTQDKDEPPIAEVQEFWQMYNKLEDRLKPAVDQLKSRLKTPYLQAIGAHEQSETHKSLVAGFDAAINIETASLISMPAATNDEQEEINSGLIETGVSIVRSKVQAIVSAKGWSREQGEFKERTAISTIRVNRINNFLAAKDIVRAKKYLTQYRDEIVTDITALEEKLATRGEAVESEIHSDIAWGKELKNPGSGYEYVDTLPPAIQKGARIELNAKANEAESARKENLRRAKQTISKQIYAGNRDKNGTMIYEKAKLTDLDQDAMATILKLDPDGAQAIEDIKQNFQDRWKTLDPLPETKLAANAEMMKMISTPGGMKQFLELDIKAQKGNRLGAALTEYWQKEQSKERRKEPTSLLSKQEMLSPYIKFARLDRPGMELIQEKMLKDLVDAQIAAEKTKGEKSGKEAIALNAEEYLALVKKTITLEKSLSYMKMGAKIPGAPVLEGGSGSYFDPFGTYAAAQFKKRQDKIAMQLALQGKGELKFTQQISNYFAGLTGKNQFDEGGLYLGDTGDKERKQKVALLTGRLVQALDTKNTRRSVDGLAALGPSERVEFIRARMETNQVYVADWGSDSRVPAFTLNIEEKSKAYVKAGGVEIMITDLDKFMENKKEKQAVYDYMDKHPGRSARTYENIAIARWEMGNIDKTAIRTKKMTEGKLKHADGFFLDRGVVVDTMLRNTLKNLKAKEMRKHVRAVYGDDGIEILDWVIRKKENGN